jgi:Holliday junction resolvase RusA-like endonuclease
MIVRFTVPGQPQGKGRARITTVNGQPRAFTPAKTRAYEAIVAEAGAKAMQGKQLALGPLHVVVTAYFAIPKSRAKDIARMPIPWHTTKPDSDNVLKVLDGLNGIVWKDDSQIVMAKVSKQYGPTPCLDILVEELA